MRKLIPLVLIFLFMNAFLLFIGLYDFGGRDLGFLGLFTGGNFAHFIFFFADAFVLSLILMHRLIKIRAPFELTFIYCIFAAVALELMQLLTGYRSFNFVDILWGGMGAGAYCLVGYGLYNKGYYSWFSS